MPTYLLYRGTSISIVVCAISIDYEPYRWALLVCAFLISSLAYREHRRYVAFSILDDYERHLRHLRRFLAGQGESE